MDGDGSYYRVDTVDTDTSLTVTENLIADYSADSYVITKTHSPDHAAYKLNIQPFTSGIIYSNPTITMPVDSKKIWPASCHHQYKFKLTAEAGKFHQYSIGFKNLAVLNRRRWTECSIWGLGWCYLCHRISLIASCTNFGSMVCSLGRLGLPSLLMQQLNGLF